MENDSVGARRALLLWTLQAKNTCEADPLICPEDSGPIPMRWKNKGYRLVVTDPIFTSAPATITVRDVTVACGATG